MAVILIKINFDEIAILASFTDLMVRISNSGEANFPIFFGFCCQTLWFACDREHLAAGCPDLFDHATINIAP